MNGGTSTRMLECARVLLGSFDKTVLMETERYKIVTIKKVSVCYFAIIDKVTKKRNIYKKMTLFERALKRCDIDKDLLIMNVKEILLTLIDSLYKEDAGKDDIDFFAIKKALFVPNKEIVVGKSKLRTLILKSTEDRNYFEMLYYVGMKNRKILTARTEVGCTEIFKMVKREDISIEEVVGTLQLLLKEKYQEMEEMN